jgi:methylated-DNA-protein-cysteine methyltransferase-like protein
MHMQRLEPGDPQVAALYERIYTVVCQVPAGMTAAYGEIAMVVGGGVDGRMVGMALGALTAERARVVPWQRIISRDGSISTRGLQQRALLEEEGVAFDDAGRVMLTRHRWSGPDAAWAAAHGFHTLAPRPDAEQMSMF